MTDNKKNETPQTGGIHAYRTCDYNQGWPFCNPPMQMMQVPSFAYDPTKCPRCGGKHFGFPITNTGDFYCTCPPQHLFGWECPRCHAINNPNKMQCDCKPVAEAIYPSVCGEPNSTTSNESL